MLMGLKAPLKEGQSFPLTLTFEKAGAVETSVAVRGAGAGVPGDAKPASGG
jgi:copper(I)-binding protein